ncbi:ATP-dependent RNA helicase SUPV3L1, mitochondrial [Trichinella nativa]|uniref:ATP-dependent RNA helicase SUV3 homolog, mitochondrial n=1 Tax=Trichinella nativa TaxID=6335 RepID=A0A0V1LMZ0_9BILA|nr:ATP-dependent RNA helicase SUPV3L1, mitochondrial [Trichinella nativa]
MLSLTSNWCQNGALPSTTRRALSDVDDHASSNAHQVHFDRLFCLRLFLLCSTEKCRIQQLQCLLLCSAKSGFNFLVSYIRITEQLFVALDAKFDVPRRKNSLFQRDEIVIVNIGKVTTLFCNLESIFTVNDVAVDPCDAEGSTCPLIRGSKASITIRFVPDREVKQLKARVHGILMKLGKVPFLLPNSDACKNSNLTCPLVAGEEYTYQQSIHVLRSYPKMNLLIKWELIEPGDEPKNGSVPIIAVMYKLLSYACLLAAAVAININFRDCGSVAGSVQNVTLDPCDNPNYCSLKRGTSPKVGILFTPSQETTAVHVVVHGIIKGLPVPFPVPNPDGCKDSGLQCPLSSNNTVHYEDVFDVKSEYPTIALLVRWELVDQNKKDLFTVARRTVKNENFDEIGQLYLTQVVRDMTSVKAVLLGLRNTGRLLQLRHLSGSKKSFEDLVVPLTVKSASTANDVDVGVEFGGILAKDALASVLSQFARRPAVRKLGAEHGLTGKFFLQALASFRRCCQESAVLPVDLHIMLADILQNSRHVDDLFPLFLRHARQVFPHLECIEELKNISDLRLPQNWYPEARSIQRRVIFHAGPTNSGKTYQALQRYLAAKSGVYCGPLKLLASEVFHKSNAAGVPCDLITGEERCLANGQTCSEHISCTVEMLDTRVHYEVAVIDEIQMMRDLQRGWAWTRALLGVCADEIHVCGESAAVDFVKELLVSLGDEFEVHTYERKTPLKVLDSPLGSLDSIQPYDCIVAFNRNDLFKVTRQVEASGRSVAMIYGSLPPGTKLAQARKFNDPDDPCDVLVATDAIGMGLNLSIRRVIFYSLVKVTLNESGEKELEPISTSQALQIAGRAGRFGTFHESGEVTTLRMEDLPALKAILTKPTEPISAAGLFPTLEQIEMFSYYLPKATLSNLLDIFVSLSAVDESRFFMCNVDDLKFLADMIEHVPLTLKVRYIFCMAPISRKKPFVCGMFLRYARKFSRGEPLTSDWLARTVGWPFSAPTKIVDLIHLEDVFDVLDTYLWLGYRFTDMFPETEQVRAMQRELDVLIRESLQNVKQLLKTVQVAGLFDQQGLNGFDSKSPTTANAAAVAKDSPAKMKQATTTAATAVRKGGVIQSLIKQGLLTPGMVEQIRKEIQADQEELFIPTRYFPITVCHVIPYDVGMNVGSTDLMLFSYLFECSCGMEVNTFAFTISALYFANTIAANNLSQRVSFSWRRIRTNKTILTTNRHQQNRLACCCPIDVLLVVDLASRATDVPHGDRCDTCRFLVRSFEKGFNDTNKSHFEGGNTAWENENLGKYSTSETRFIEIMELICSKKSKDVKEESKIKNLESKCHAMAEEHEETLETWYYHNQKKYPDLFDWFCIRTVKVCCPDNTFGASCAPCPGDPKRPCFGNGICEGSGSRFGSGKCKCHRGYQGKLCRHCDSNFFKVHSNETYILCQPCHESCKGGCSGEGPKECNSCRVGWIMDEDTGCKDIDECESSPCTDQFEKCENTPGSYKCVCAEAFRREDGVCIPDPDVPRPKPVFFGLLAQQVLRYASYFGLLLSFLLILLRPKTPLIVLFTLIMNDKKYSAERIENSKTFEEETHDEL